MYTWKMVSLPHVWHSFHLLPSLNLRPPISSCYVFLMFFASSEVWVSTGVVLWHHCHCSSGTLWPQLLWEFHGGGKLRWNPNSKTPARCLIYAEYAWFTFPIAIIAGHYPWVGFICIYHGLPLSTMFLSNGRDWRPVQFLVMIAQDGTSRR